MREERDLMRLVTGLLIVLALILILPYFMPWHWWHCGPCFWGPWKGLWFLAFLIIILAILFRP